MDPYSFLLGKMEKEELERGIEEKINAMHGFLTRESAIRILATEMGIGEEKTLLSEIGEGANRIMAVARIARVLPLQKFANGKKMRKIVLSDRSGERELKLWNEDADFGGIHTGDVVEVRGIYCKNNELGLGYSGMITVVERASFANLGALPDLEGMQVNARGFVESAGAGDFVISDGKNSARVVLDKPGLGKELPAGAEVKVENALVRNGGLHMGAHSRLLVKRKKDGITGVVGRMGAREGKLVLEIRGKEYEFAREVALGILGAEVAEDIALETIVELKKNEYVGKEIFIEKKAGKYGKIIVRG